MFGYGPFETSETESRPTGRRTPRWARVALFGPWALVLTWGVTEVFGLSPPWLFWVVIVSLVLGSGSVLIACAYQVSTAWVQKLLPRGRKPDA
jgi:hypothetical protein